MPTFVSKTFLLHDIFVKHLDIAFGISAIISANIRFFAVFQIKKDSVKDRRSPFTHTLSYISLPAIINQKL